MTYTRLASYTHSQPSWPFPQASLLFSETSLRLGQWGTLLRPWEEQLAVTNLQEGQGGPGSEQQEQDPRGRHWP